MLEKFISLFERLVIAVEKQNQFFGDKAFLVPGASAGLIGNAALPTPAQVEAKMQADVAQKKVEAPNPFQAAVQAAVEQLPSQQKQQTAPVSREQVSKALVELATSNKGRDAAMAVLLPFCPGKTATDDKLMDAVDPNNYGALLTAIQKASAA